MRSPCAETGRKTTIKRNEHETEIERDIYIERER